jgi:prevent-host-death family protein
MSSIAATDAKNRFGQVLEMARSEPVHIQKNGRDVGILVSPEDYSKLVAASAGPKVRPEVERLLAKSIERRKSLYEALAK